VNSATRLLARTAPTLARGARVAGKTFVTVPPHAQSFEDQTKGKPVTPGPKAPVTSAPTFSRVPPKPIEGALDNSVTALADDLDTLAREHPLFKLFDNLAEAAKNGELTKDNYIELRDVTLAYAYLRENDSLGEALNCIADTGFNLPNKTPLEAYQALVSSEPMIHLLRVMQESSSTHLHAAQKLIDAHLADCLEEVLFACKGSMTPPQFDRQVRSSLTEQSCDPTALAMIVNPQGRAEADTAAGCVDRYASAFEDVVRGSTRSAV
jgi:hypothetical protein